MDADIIHLDYVNGCDGSILLRHDGDKSNVAGNAVVGGFSIIEDAKSELERVCPRVVSCSDIVALAARDAVFLAHGPFYEIPTKCKKFAGAPRKHGFTLMEIQRPWSFGPRPRLAHCWTETSQSKSR